MRNLVVLSPPEVTLLWSIRISVSEGQVEGLDSLPRLLSTRLSSLSNKSEERGLAVECVLVNPSPVVLLVPTSGL